MNDLIIGEMLRLGWTYPVIALRTGICENRLREGNLGTREERKLYEIASIEARIDIDLLGDEE